MTKNINWWQGNQNGNMSSFGPVRQLNTTKQSTAAALCDLMAVTAESMPSSLCTAYNRKLHNISIGQIHIVNSVPEAEPVYGKYHTLE